MFSTEYDHIKLILLCFFADYKIMLDISLCNSELDFIQELFYYSLKFMKSPLTRY